MKNKGCEFCGKGGKLASTTFFCNYCKRCLRLVISECQCALREMDEKKSKSESKAKRFFKEFMKQGDNP